MRRVRIVTNLAQFVRNRPHHEGDYRKHLPGGCMGFGSHHSIFHSFGRLIISLANYMEKQMTVKHKGSEKWGSNEIINLGRDI